jgi:hypothetical protein
MLPDHDHFRDSVSPDDAEPVARDHLADPGRLAAHSGPGERA